MSARRDFLRNITLAIAASLVPRILQPSIPEVVEEEGFVMTLYLNSDVTWYQTGDFTFADLEKSMKECKQPPEYFSFIDGKVFKVPVPSAQQ